ncbi:hypothetical protein INT48_009279 [Thamnidium elegans]|uniref:Fork-head domain-containing protein n=1 Tax=Thamnidium elegans TaxID=101142 RepID=A0A8H7SK05_9FUNG|nr:hypothetical protein INT48_009279 [Thamnidium elegans]
MDKLVNTKTVRRRRSDCAWKKSSISTSSLKHIESHNEVIEYPAGPIHITSSWNPVNRSDKPPYSYATIIGHAILTSKERKLTLNDIYVWITENYPFYSNDTQGWQNSIRHNLSLHKAFVKIERDSTSQTPPRKGCFWTIRQGKEKSFIDNLQKPVNSVRKQQSLSHLAPSITRRQQQRRSSVLVSSAETHSHNNNNGLFNTFRATVIPTHTVTTNLVPESEPITSHHELFGDDLQSYTYSTTSGTSYVTDQPPSLSPCDAYSTTSSSFADNHLFYPRGSQDYSNRMYPNNQLLYKGYNNNVMDWSTSQTQDSSLKHDSVLYSSNSTISPSYYFLDQQSRLHGNSDFSSFLHR